MRSDLGEVDIGLVSYLRYLNQGALARPTPMPSAV